MHRRLALKACAFGLLPAPLMSLADPTRPHAYDDPRLHLIGRFQREGEDSVRFAWSGSALAFGFRGTRVSIPLSDSGQNRFLLEVDGAQRILTAGAEARQLVLAENLPAGEHRVRLTRITEAMLGESVFTGPPVSDGEWLVTPRRVRRLLVIGDSITAGYGVEGANENCGFSPQTENQQLSYAAVAANALDAELHSLAWSGKGVYRNYGEARPQGPNMSTLHRRVLPARAGSAWQDADYSPHAIIVNLGSNDFWNGAPAAGHYDEAMAALVEDLARTHDAVPIYLMASPLLAGSTRAAQVRALERLCAERGRTLLLDIERVREDEGWGCDFHPGRATHARQGAELARRLRADLGWA